MKNSILALILLLSCGCSNFLSEYSQDMVRAKTIADFDEVLLGSVYLPIEAGTEKTFIGNNNVLSWLNILDDDINAVQTESGSASGSWNLRDRYMSVMENNYGNYTWQYNVKLKPDGSEGYNDATTWNDLYTRINYTNVILDELKDIEPKNDTEILQKNRVLAETHFLRAQFYFFLTNLYGAPYAPSTASTTLSVPLKLTAYVEHDKDKDTQFDREPVAKVYDQIISDLQQAIAYLSISDKGVIYRATRESAVLLLSRVYLYTQKWQEAKDLLEPEMQASTFPLTSLVGGDTLNTENRFLTEDNAEIIFSQGSLFSQRIMTAVPMDFCVTRDLYDLYEENDMRRFCFTIDSTTIDGITTADSVALSYKFATGDLQSKVSDVLMIRNAEAYLNMAEACAMLEDGTANQYLNELRSMRVNNYTAQSYSGEDLVTQIRNERRKELCFEGHRWFDLRRYTVSNPYPYTKEIRRVYPFYTRSSSSLYTLDHVYTYVLEENDPAYTFDIPRSVKEFDVVPMPGNDRPERPALEEQ